MNTPKKIRSFYNRFSQYDEFQKSEGWQIPKLLVALTAPHLNGGEFIVDVGCGPGLVGEELNHINWNGTLVGVDIAEQRLREAAQKFVYNFCLQADAYRLPFLDQTFDIVLTSAMVGLTGHDSVAEMLRILKPGGVFACAAGEIKSKHWCRKRYQEVITYFQEMTGVQVLLNQDLGSGYTNEYNGEHYSCHLLRKT